MSGGADPRRGKDLLLKLACCQAWFCVDVRPFLQSKPFGNNVPKIIRIYLRFNCPHLACNTEVPRIPKSPDV